MSYLYSAKIWSLLLFVQDHCAKKGEKKEKNTRKCAFPTVTNGVVKKYHRNTKKNHKIC